MLLVFVCCECIICVGHEWLVCLSVIFCFFSVFFFKQKTAYEMRISDWSSDVCSSDLCWTSYRTTARTGTPGLLRADLRGTIRVATGTSGAIRLPAADRPITGSAISAARPGNGTSELNNIITTPRSEEHTSELQSLMRISYAVFCLKKKKKNITHD